MADGLFDFFSGGGDSGFADVQGGATAPVFNPTPPLFDLGDPQTGAPNPPISPSGGMLESFGGGKSTYDTGGDMSLADRMRAGGFDFTKYLPALIPGAAGLIGYARGQGGATDKAIGELHGVTGPMQGAGNQALNAYTSGKLTPAQQAAVDQYRKQAMAKWQQYMANAGIPVSSAQADIENKVNMDTMAYANQLLQQDFQNAYAATGMTATNLTNVARMQALQDQEQRAQWAEFMKELGKIGGDIFSGEGGGILNV
jgi:hypothetical protein